MGRFAIPAVALAMAGLLFLLLHDVGDGVDPIVLRSAQDAAVPPPPPIYQPVELKPVPDAALLVDESQMTREDVLKVGLLGREARWVETIMVPPSWRADNSADGTTWINRNEVRLSWRIREGRVLGAEARFPTGAQSADLTALSGVFVGQNDHFLVEGESFHEVDTRLKTGEFVAENGQRYYYRLRLSDQGQAPFGPAFFEVSLRPFKAE